jgi:C1A family cysteine protease
MDDFLYKLDYQKDPVDNRDYKFASSPLFTVEAPKVFDWTADMSPVKDQGSLGSCVGFALTAMKEWQEVREKRKERKVYGVTLRDVTNLSEAWVYWNAKQIDPWPGVEGTSIRYAMKVLQKQGVPPEYSWEYNDDYPGGPQKSAPKLAIWGMIGSYWRVESLKELKKALTVQPVPIGIACFKEILSVGSSGVIPMPANPNKVLGGHAICCVGFDDNKQLLKFKNSWSSKWGQNGYGYLTYEYADKYLLDAWSCFDLRIDAVKYRKIAKQLNLLEQVKVRLPK